MDCNKYTQANARIAHKSATRANGSSLSSDRDFRVIKTSEWWVLLFDLFAVAVQATTTTFLRPTATAVCSLQREEGRKEVD